MYVKHCIHTCAENLSLAPTFVDSVSTSKNFLFFPVNARKLFSQSSVSKGICSHRAKPSRGSGNLIAHNAARLAAVDLLIFYQCSFCAQFLDIILCIPPYHLIHSCVNFWRPLLAAPNIFPRIQIHI